MNTLLTPRDTALTADTFMPRIIAMYVRLSDGKVVGTVEHRRSRASLDLNTTMSVVEEHHAAHRR